MIYAITDQDRSYKQNTPYNISCHQWLRKEFEKELVFLWDESAWLYQNETGRDRWDEYQQHIQNHGELGKEYPKYKYGVEGDTPAFLHVIPNGLNNSMNPNQISWGGYFEWGAGPDTITYAYNNHNGQAKKISRKYEEYFYPIVFNDFRARMDWAKDGEGNLNPIVIINKQGGIDPIQI